MSVPEKPAIYHPRKPHQSPLWKLLDEHYHCFEQHYEERFAKSYGYFRLVVRDVVQDYLKCGDLREGFARVRCPDCRHEYLLAFSCRGRWFCPSCHSKKGIQFGEHLKETILYPVPHRQYVFSIPIILRGYFRYDRKLLSKLCRCASKSLVTFFRTALGVQSGALGAVMAIQTFGDYGKWHPHLHILVADGLFFENGSFYVMPRVELQPLQELFRASVLKMLKKEGKIGGELIGKIMRWRHTSGFSVHNGVQLARDDAEGGEALAQYIIRNPFSLEKLRYKEETGAVIYRSKMTHGKNRSNFKIFGAEEFIATITQHIPEKSFQLVRYYGWYSSRARGDRRLRQSIKDTEAREGLLADPAVEVLDVAEHKTRRIPSKTWRECIKKVWEVDPLICPHCRAEMKIVSFINEAVVIRRILDHLGLWSEVKPAARPPPEPVAVFEYFDYEPIDDGWAGYDEPCIQLN
jgi:ribosomal protein S27E